MRILWLFAILCNFPSFGLTLPEARTRALSSSPVLQGLQEEVHQARAQGNQVWAGYFPKLGVAGGAERRPGQSVGLGFVYADWNLFRGFEDAYRTDMVRTDLDSAEVRLDRARFRVGLQVESQFYRCLLKETAMKLRQEALDMNANHRKMASVRAGAGISTASDVMEFDLRETLLRSDLAHLTEELEEARIALRKLLGNFEEPLALDGTLQHHHVKGEWASVAAKIRANAEPVRLAALELKKAGIESKLWRSKWLPTISVEAQYGYLDLDSRPADGGLGTRALLLAKLNLFDGFRTDAEREEGASKRARAEARLEEATRTALAEGEVAFRRLSTTQFRVDLEANNEEKAQKYYTAVVSEYRRGVKDSGDVRAAAEMLYDARLRKKNFMYDFIESRLELERLTGQALETELIHSH